MMKWEMEIEEIEAVLEKIWDLHDKLSDAIHSISRSHFLNSIKTLKNSDEIYFTRNQEKKKRSNNGEEDRSGFVFVKDFRVDDDAAIAEAKSLNAIRTALENLEDQLEFFHVKEFRDCYVGKRLKNKTVQTQQRAERDAAIARLEQSRMVLAMRLADHHGKKYRVIEEALAFVGDVHDLGRFVAPENPFGSPRSQSGENLVNHEGKRSNILMRVMLSSFTFVKKSLKLEQMGGVLGNAALVAVSMLALLHLHQVTFKNDFVEVPQMQENSFYGKRNNKSSSDEVSSPSGRARHLDVLAARG